MASSSSQLPSFHILNPAARRWQKLPVARRILRCQSLSDEEKPANIVDENLKVLRERIEGMREKERRRVDNGWSCLWSNNGGTCERKKREKDKMISDGLEVVGVVSGAVGVVVAVGSLGICVVSLLVHTSYGLPEFLPFFFGFCLIFRLINGPSGL